MRDSKSNEEVEYVEVENKATASKKMHIFFVSLFI